MANVTKIRKSSVKKSINTSKKSVKNIEKVISDNIIIVKNDYSFENTSQINVPKNLISQVIGQDESVHLIRKAAAQKRNVLLVGIPGTGKSLLAQAMSEILPVQKLMDVLIYPNYEDSNNPKVRSVKAGDGKKIIDQARLESRKSEDTMRLISFILPIGWMILASALWQFGWYSDIIFAALLLIGVMLLIGLSIGGQMRSKEGVVTPKLLVNNLGKKVAPFFEATGARAGALLGDVRHDPLQCHYGFNKMYVKKENELQEKPFAELWDEMKDKYSGRIETNEKGYEAIMLPDEEEIYTLGEKDGKVVLSRILSLNRKPFDGEMIEIETDGKSIALTPEHSVITKKGDKEAEKVSDKDSLFKLG